MASSKTCNNFLALIFLFAQASICLALGLFVNSEDFEGLTLQHTHWESYKNYYLFFAFVFGLFQLALSLALQMVSNMCTNRYGSLSYWRMVNNWAPVAALCFDVGPILVGLLVCFSAPENYVTITVSIAAIGHALFSWMVVALPHAHFCHKILTTKLQPLIGEEELIYPNVQ